MRFEFEVYFMIIFNDFNFDVVELIFLYFFMNGEVFVLDKGVKLCRMNVIIDRLIESESNYVDDLKLFVEVMFLFLKLVLKKVDN